VHLTNKVEQQSTNSVSFLVESAQTVGGRLSESVRILLQTVI